MRSASSRCVRASVNKVLGLEPGHAQLQVKQPPQPPTQRSEAEPR
jgi:hypothetical protein